MTITTIKEFGDAILEGVRADFNDLPKGATFAWFNNPSTNSPTMFKHGEPVPFDSFSRVIALFQDDDVVRIYTMPAAPPNPIPADWKARSPTRYTLTKTAPTYFAETMNLDAMASEMIEEWNAIADGINAADIELESVIEYIEGLAIEGAMVNSSVLLEGLRNEEHREEDDSDPEPETEPDASAAPAVPTDAPAQEATPS
jgi:hypothetical protein